MKKNDRRLLTAPIRYGKARGTSRQAYPVRDPYHFCQKDKRQPMVKPEWGTKRTCPKCATRFYDLGKDEPVHCIECGNVWTPEPVLKSKQPLPYEEAPQKTVAEKPEVEAADDDLDIDIDVDEEEGSPDNDVDLGGDDDLGVDAVEGDDDEN
jgi:uncharacterized protein (TIGR02300 family)